MTNTIETTWTKNNSSKNNGHLWGQLIGETAGDLRDMYKIELDASIPDSHVLRSQIDCPDCVHLEFDAA